MKIVLTIIFFLFCTIALYKGSAPHFSDRVFVSGMLIIGISLFNIFKDEEKPYSLYKMFFLFSFFFFGVAPLVQFNDQSSSYGARVLKEEEFYFMNLLIIFILGVYQFLYKNFHRIRLKIKEYLFIDKYLVPSNFSIKQNLMLLFLGLTSFSMVFYANNFSVLSLLIRGGEFKEEYQIESSTFALMIGQFIRPISMIVLFYYILLPKKNNIIFLILFVLAILTCFPLGMARFAAAAMYIPFVLLTIPLFKRKNIFVLSIVFGLLILFPFLNNFRDLSSDQEIRIGLNLEMFNEGHFDSYQNFAFIVSDNIITWGRQLLGVILFWVPRSLWPSKPIGSGAHLAEEINLGFDNISANYFAEGYVNFGFIGILLFLIILAYFSARFDKMYWEHAVKSNKSFFKVIYYILLGMLFFMLRGDLLSSFAYTSGFMIAGLLVYKLSENKSQYKN